MKTEATIATPRQRGKHREISRAGRLLSGLRQENQQSALRDRQLKIYFQLCAAACKEVAPNDPVHPDQYAPSHASKMGIDLSILREEARRNAADSSDDTQ